MTTKTTVGKTYVHPLIKWLNKCLDETEADNTPIIQERARRHVLNPEQYYVLADIKAKRRMMARHTPHGSTVTPLCTACPRGQHWPCPEIRDAASVFADRTGYRKEWKPEE